MEDKKDIKDHIMELIKKLPPEELARVNEAMHDALISAARGEPSSFPINEMVHIPREEARRICRKIGLRWEPDDADPAG